MFYRRNILRRTRTQKVILQRGAGQHIKFYYELCFMFFFNFFFILCTVPNITFNVDASE